MLKSLRRILALGIGISSAFNTQVLNLGGIKISYILILSILYIISIVNLFNYNKLRLAYGKGIGGFFYFYIYLCLINFITSIISNSQVSILNQTIALNIILFYAVLSHALFDRKGIVYIFWGFVLGCIVLSTMFVLGIGLTINIYDGRLTMLNLNPNDLGIYMTISSVFLYIEVISRDCLKIKILRYLFFMPITIMVTVILATGSRTALLLLLLMFLIYTLLHESKYKYIVITCSLFTFGVGCFYLLNSDLMIVERLLESKETGDTSGRTDIWHSLLPYIMENPIFGYGEVGYSRISESAFNNIVEHNYTNYEDGKGFSPHNVIIEVLLYTGVIGLYFIYKCWKTIYRNAISQLKCFKNCLPLVLLMPVVFAILSGQILEPRHYYFLYLLCLINLSSNNTNMIACNK